MISPTAMRTCIVCCLLLLPMAGRAAVPALSLAQLQAQATDRKLGEHPEWRQLLHYRKEAGGRSQVDAAAFFLAADGRHQPQAELLATLAALMADGPPGDEHAQCRYPARRQWLSEQLQLGPQQWPEADCPLYQQWRAMVPAGRLTLVFPAYHLNSPSSMFGHTLLRVDPAARENWTEWLGFSVSFGADVRSDDNSLFYAIKGLTGGYPGLFIVTPYFEKIREYNKIENRDIWEYELNLSPAEVDRMVRHLWELKEMAFDYYFFDENCSYRVLELLEVARPGLRLTDGFQLTAIPVDTVRVVVDAGLVGQTHYRPSRATTLEHRLAALAPAEQELVKQLASTPDQHELPAFQKLPAERQRAVIDSAYEYLRFLNARGRRDADVAQRSHQLLRLLNKYPAPAAEPGPAPPAPPEQSHHSKRLQLGAARVAGEREARVGFRMSFHDLEARDVGFLRGAQINIASVDFRWRSQRSARLERLDLVDIFSLTPRDDFFKPWSWAVRLGIEQAFVDGEERRVGQVNGGGGFAWRVSPSGTLYSLLSGRLEAHHRHPGGLGSALGLRLGLLEHLGWSSVHLKAEARRDDRGHRHLSLNYRQDFFLARNQAISLQLGRRLDAALSRNELALNYHHYFD